MTFLSTLKSAAVATMLLFSAQVAQASVVALIEAEGEIDAVTNGTGLFVTVDNYTGTLLDPTLNVDANASYSFGLSATFDRGLPPVSGQFTVPNQSLSDIVATALGFVSTLDPSILASLSAALGVIDDATGTITDIGNGLFMSFSNLTGPTITPTGFSGSFELYFGDTDTPAFNPGTTGFDLTLSISQVPLPASLPLMVVALGGLGFVVRRKKA